MRIELNLSRHCIATEVKRRYEACMRAYWKASQDREVLEQEIDGLKKSNPSGPPARIGFFQRSRVRA